MDNQIFNSPRASIKSGTEIRETLPLHVDRLFTSSLYRCTKLSERLATHFGLLPEKDVRLMEMNFGDWEMKRWDDIDQSMWRGR